MCTVGEGAALALGLGPGEVARSPSPVGGEEECPLGAGMGRQMARAWCRGPRAAAATVKVIGGCYRRCSLFRASALGSSQGAGGPPEQGGRVGELPERSRGAQEGTRPPCTLAVRDPPRPLLLTGAGQTSPCFPTQGETFARKPEPDGRSSRSPRPVPAHGALGSAFGFLARRPDRGRRDRSFPGRARLQWPELRRSGPLPSDGVAVLYRVPLITECTSARLPRCFPDRRGGRTGHRAADRGARAGVPVPWPRVPRCPTETESPSALVLAEQTAAPWSGWRPAPGPRLGDCSSLPIALSRVSFPLGASGSTEHSRAARVITG